MLTLSNPYRLADALYDVDLVVVEGPHTSGKTRLCHLLTERGDRKLYKTGQALYDRNTMLSYGLGDALNWERGLETGGMFFVPDLVAQLMIRVVCDRGFLSTAVFQPELVDPGRVELYRRALKRANGYVVLCLPTASYWEAHMRPAPEPWVPDRGENFYAEALAFIRVAREFDLGDRLIVYRPGGEGGAE